MALSHAILAVLSNRPCSGYDLAKQFDGSVGFFWNASHQQIYRELTKLEEQGLISVEVIHQESRPDKKQYSLTPIGQTTLRDWIIQPSSPSPIKDEVLVKLFVGHLVPLTKLQTLLQAQRQQHEELLATYKTIEQQFLAHPGDLPHNLRCQYLTLRNGIHFETSWLTWCDEALTTLAQSTPSDR
jgi:DNA-binding PadR family transcriptional regulator